MRFEIAGEHISFFERYGYVEFESFFSLAEVTALRRDIEMLIEQRAIRNGPCWETDGNVLGSTLPYTNDPWTLYGYDMAIASTVVRKALCSPKIGRSAFAFVRKKPLRYAFDRLWNAPSGINSPIEELSSVTPIMIGLIVALEDRQSGEEQHKPFEYRSLPSAAGSVAFISPKTMMTLPDTTAGRYIVVGYASGVPIYRFQPQDRQTHALKQLGYVFGDRLKETTHPVVFR